MLSNRTAGQKSTFIISVLDEDGTKPAGTSASWELFDERGTSLAADAVADFDPASDHVSFEVEAGDLALDAGVSSAGREIVVKVATTGAEWEIRDYFVLVNSRPLALMTNSLVTYPEALSLRQSFGPTLDGWDAAVDPTLRSSALAEAYEHMMRLQFQVPFMDPMTVASSYAAYGTGTDMPWDYTRRVWLRGMSLAEFDKLPEHFRRAVKRAQLVEANVLLGGDSVGKKRRDGIIQEKIGESQAMFSDKPYLNLPISRQAYEEVKRFIIFKIGVARG